MRVLRVSFVGTRTTDFDATVSLFRDVLGMESAFANPGWAGFRLPSGERDLLEIFGRPDIDNRVVPPEFEQGVLIALAVDDIVTAKEELAAAGIELIGDLVWATDLTGSTADAGWGWCFFRGPDGNVYVLQQDGLAGDGDPRPPVM
jgi:catechol 2,3-dioxygenase-like lactoylglutathione lyase family enzyme